jgi:hypothetical protein
MQCVHLRVQCLTDRDGPSILRMKGFHSG